MRISFSAAKPTPQPAVNPKDIVIPESIDADTRETLEMWIKKGQTDKAKQYINMHNNGKIGRFEPGTN